MLIHGIIASAISKGAGKVVGSRSGSSITQATALTLNDTYTDGILVAVCSVDSSSAPDIRANTAASGDLFTSREANWSGGGAARSYVTIQDIDASTVTGGVSSVYIESHDEEEQCIAVIWLPNTYSYQTSTSIDTTTADDTLTTASFTANAVYSVAVFGQEDSSATQDINSSSTHTEIEHLPIGGGVGNSGWVGWASHGDISSSTVSFTVDTVNSDQYMLAIATYGE